MANSFSSDSYPSAGWLHSPRHEEEAERRRATRSLNVTASLQNTRPLSVTKPLNVSRALSMSLAEEGNQNTSEPEEELEEITEPERKPHVITRLQARTPTTSLQSFFQDLNKKS